MTPLQCPNCQTSILPDDRFCENCGIPLFANTPLSATGCAKCGCSDLDPEGYCSQCGFRNASNTNALSSDRIELAVSSQLAAVSDRGLRSDRNEDYVIVQTTSDNSHVLVVCDGVSSSETPELAAQAAGDAACQSLIAALQADEDAEIALQRAIATALNAVCKIPYRQGGSEPPSTTIVAAMVQASQIAIAWLGDSRAYWITTHEIQQLTRDDSWLQDAIASGQLSEAEARQSPQAHAITRWLGADAIEDALPTIVTLTVSEPGYLLLCSDGLWNYAPNPHQLAELVRRFIDSDTLILANRLVEYARLQGGRDNITVALLSLS